MNNKALNMLGLAQKAGKMVGGYDATNIAILNKKAMLVFIASDISNNTKEKILFVCQKNNINLCRQFSTAELSHIMGKNRKILAVTDSGFAKAIMKKINEGE
ncbi:ribosomal L7Ae/L30e/S12e/Gadd45 family protein [Lactobacillus iners]|uniref:L7Ae/L30e/S12e/Gadd45 family ribosomal protein n=1 Tax=Lactobacillus iners TaxID=147802 RepID=UPI0001E99DF6|nr:ribosomal L7Ae/L30e/S12e/Gadd45 family protein [Lactobacillus iners]EFQ50809.1 ribosomal protein L7Ae [Lactobacillus iners LEAF 2062A-h1]EFQ50987.1 ribosomal protein L7Ae [Lactobacillus iners LEAF 3008A-a]